MSSRTRLAERLEGAGRAGAAGEARGQAGRLLPAFAGDAERASVLIALAAGAGSLFLVHLPSNTSWLPRSLLGQTTRGALQTCSATTSAASVVVMGPILVLSLVL